MMPTVTGLAMLLVSALPGRAADVTAAGLWQKTEDGKPVIWVLMVDHHDGMFEGVIAKTFPLPIPTRFARNAPTTARTRQCAGISFIRNMKRNGLEYEGGNVLDPRNGDVWKAKMSVSPDGQALTLRGYILTPLLGKNETWQRLPDTELASVDPAIVAKYLAAQTATATKPPPASAKKTAGPSH